MTYEEREMFQEMRGQRNQLLEFARYTLSELEHYVNNPSAWDAFDSVMSERLRRVVERARSAAKVTSAANMESRS